jgi:cytochrome c-type biogenesis protein CcmI
MMAIIVAVVLSVLALAFVLYPLYRGRFESAPGADVPDVPSTSTTDERERAARGALQEVELDHQLGNISDKDYQTLRERYMRSALVALKSRYDREQELDELIEDQLRKMKEGHEEHNAE